MNRYLLVLSALMLMILGACSKGDDAPTAEEDLRNGIWGRTPSADTFLPGKVTYKDPLTNGDSTRGYYPGGLVCHMDNTIQFLENNKGQISYGAKKCSGSESVTKTFTWAVSQDGNHLSMYGVGDFFGTDAVEATIVTRTLGVLTITYKQVTLDPRFQTSDTLKFTDVIRKR
jgi:hypothetical protein